MHPLFFYYFEKARKGIDNHGVGRIIRGTKLSFALLTKEDNMNEKAVNNVPGKDLTPTMEDYLEAIYNLSQEKRVVRVKDIAKRLGVKMPTVTNMLKTLSERGMIDYEKYEYLELTGKGSYIGSQIDQRHQTLKVFLTDILQIDRDQADEDACKMEHSVSPATLERMVEFMEFVEDCPRGGMDWLEYFDEYRRHGKSRERCLERMKRFARKYEAEIHAMNEDS
jgi:DtxR family Mn-dependent transcriptional regulator